MITKVKGGSEKKNMRKIKEHKETSNDRKRKLRGEMKKKEEERNRKKKTLQ